MSGASIATSLTRRVLAIGVLAALLATLLLILRIYLDEVANAQRHLAEIEQTQLAPLTEALWTIDAQRIDALLDGIAQRAGVTSVLLTSTEGERWSSGPGGEPAWLQTRLPLIHPQQPRQALGELQVHIGRSHGIARVLRQLPLVLGIVLVSMLGAAWVIARQFRRRVAEPLQALASMAHALNGLDLARPLNLPNRSPSTQGDEIDQLLVAFDQARQRLHQGIARQAEQAEALRRHGEKLEETVALRTTELRERVEELAQAHVATETARRQAEQFAARTTDFAEISADGFWETDARLRLVLVSHSFAQLVGTTVLQMLGKTPDEVFRERFPQAPELAPYMAPLRQRQAFDNQLLRLVDADGKRHWVLNKGKPIYDRNGEFQGFRGAITDITEARDADRALKASERRFRMITDNVPALISYIDAERRFRFNNKVYQDWLRKPLEEITDRRLEEVYGPEVYASIAPHLDRAFDGERVSFELDLQGRVYRATYVPELDGRGQVVGIFGLIHDITRLKRVERDLRLAADFDALTGLPNRRHFEQVLDQALQRAEAEDSTMALLFIDLDHFKVINDELGHAAGDAVLRHVASQLRQNLRATDTPARLAGDEFVVILEYLGDPREASLIAAKLLRAIAKPMSLGEGQRSLSASIGVALRQAGQVDGESLLRRADTALYQSKDAGRGCVNVAA